MQLNIKGHVAIVTGGSRGIGRAIVKTLAAEGCRVAFNYARSQSDAATLEKKTAGIGTAAKSYQVDISDFAAVKQWVEKVKQDFGRLDILVNNAGIIADKALMMMTEEDWTKVITTNLNGTFHASRACIVTFMKQKQGRIVNISSVSGIIGLPRQTNYSASKGGINAFTKALAKEVAGYGIRINAVAPGFIETEMLAGLSDEYRTKVLEEIPLGRMGRPEDVADAVKFLLSDDAAYITGQILIVDGGLAMR